MSQDKLCDNLLNVLDLSSIFEQIEADQKMISKKKTEIVPAVSKPLYELNLDNMIDNMTQFNHKVKEKKDLSSQNHNDSKFNAVFGHIPITSINFIGKIKRTVPYSQEGLQTVPVQALKRKMDEFGVPEAMPIFYENRVKRFIEMGLVEPGGEKFTPDGQKIAAEHLLKKGISEKKAYELASSARSLKLSKQRGELASSGITRRSISGDITTSYIIKENGLAEKK